MHYEILDAGRQHLLPLMTPLKEHFYLAGGTGLALQLGHRDSIDFDFFCDSPIDTTQLFEELLTIFVGHKMLKTQAESSTLSVLIDEAVRMSFMAFPYPLVQPLLEEPHLRIASLPDIACMKLLAITGRATSKDYVDIFFLLKRFTLGELIAHAAQKFHSLDTNLILKSLVYFDDMLEEPIRFTAGNEVPLSTIKTILQKMVKEFVSPIST